MRKKHIQSVITFVLTFVLAIGVFGRTVSASETENKYRVFLKDIGASDEYINGLTDEQLELLYNKYSPYKEKIHFSSYETKIVEIENSDASNDERAANIPPSKLKLSIDTIDFTDSNGYVVTVCVDAMYEWLSTPILNLTDAHTFNFDPKQFYFSELYGCSCFKYNGLQYADEVFTPAKASDGGVAWYLKIGSGSVNKGNNQGYCSITLKTIKKYKPGNCHSNMYYEYAHQTGALGISVSISGISLGFSGGNYDSQAITYRY